MRERPSATRMRELASRAFRYSTGPDRLGVPLPRVRLGCSQRLVEPAAKGRPTGPARVAFLPLAVAIALFRRHKAGVGW